MANTAKADHKATSNMAKLTQERVKAIVLLIVQLFSVVQTGLSLAGISQLPFTSDQVSTAITGVIAVIASIYAWWRNNNITAAAVAGQRITDRVKTGAQSSLTSIDPELMPTAIQLEASGIDPDVLNLMAENAANETDASDVEGAK
ncbi:MAG: phage holin [Bifidobacterium breve]|nr:phage holin [Bifidobacterium breve]